jgi:hypothetical protein
MHTQLVKKRNYIARDEFGLSSRLFCLFCDTALWEKIETLEGVLKVSLFNPENAVNKKANWFVVTFDPRYDRSEVIDSLFSWLNEYYIQDEENTLA